MKNDWTEEKIQDKLRLYFLSRSTKKYEMFSKFVYDWESDYLAITKSGYAYECEIKISRADFFNDSKKTAKHLILESDILNRQRPNYFYYAVPKDLIKPEEVPNGYGLIYIESWNVTIVKQADKIHKEKVDIDKLNLIDKFYYGMWDYIDKYRHSDITALKRTIKALEKDIMEYDNLISEYTTIIDDLKLENKKLNEQLNNKV